MPDIDETQTPEPVMEPEDRSERQELLEKVRAILLGNPASLTDALQKIEKAFQE